jgi:hypothetical protein
MSGLVGQSLPMTPGRRMKFVAFGMKIPVWPPLATHTQTEARLVTPLGAA